ncbi:tetratricopeptide TPR_1 repeat-containing protein [Prevotella sp. CAG:1124]|nr:tetratricopeptide TPR_1 repeat-containing protein [Prevotella sp. CAG:1124]
MAKVAIAEKRYSDAVGLLEECLVYPPHLGEGKLYGAQENDFYYLLGISYEALGDTDKARQCWEQATLGPTEPAAALYYNDAKPDKIFYQGLALLKLGRTAEANGRFHRLGD